MNYVSSLKCVICEKEYGVDETLYVCPHHGDSGILDVRYNYEKVSEQISPQTLSQGGPHSMWRYIPLLPIDQSIATESQKDQQPNLPFFSVGWTPLYRPQTLEKQFGLAGVHVKDDGCNPSGSLKDRASALAILKAKELGFDVVGAASTGNAASSLATLSAGLGVKTIVFVPATAPQAKIAQLLVCGATVLTVNGGYDEACDLCLSACTAYGWYNRNTAYNPYMTEGKKTVAYEICEQLHWQVPERIFVSVGNGCIIGGLHKGFRDMLALGWIDRMPRLMGVQAGAAPLYHAWLHGIDPLDMTLMETKTIADSISAGFPRDRVKAMRAVVESSGAFISVTDEEILGAIPKLGSDLGVFAEPAGAAAYAGFAKVLSERMISSNETVVVLVTGTGLKDVASAIKSVGEPIPIEPTLDDVEKALRL